MNTPPERRWPARLRSLGEYFRGEHGTLSTNTGEHYIFHWTTLQIMVLQKPANVSLALFDQNATAMRFETDEGQSDNGTRDARLPIASMQIGTLARWLQTDKPACTNRSPCTAFHQS